MSCVLVGNGTSVLDSPRGDVIDAFDTIVRFNNCDLVRFAPSTGKLTHVWFTVWPYSEARMKKFKPLERIFLHTWQSPEKCSAWASFRGIPNAQKVSHETLVEMRAFGPKGYVWYSTGAVAAWLMLKEHQSISLIGFDWWDRVAHHYADKAIRGTTHKPDKEKEFFDKLVAEGKVNFL